LFLPTRAFQLGNSSRRVLFVWKPSPHLEIVSQDNVHAHVPVKHGQHYLIIVHVSCLPQIAFMKGKEDSRERYEHTVECHLQGWFWFRQ
jgi:hypothetical protein